MSKGSAEWLLLCYVVSAVTIVQDSFVAVTTTIFCLKPQFQPTFYQRSSQCFYMLKFSSIPRWMLEWIQKSKRKTNNRVGNESRMEHRKPTNYIVLWWWRDVQGIFNIVFFCPLSYQEKCSMAKSLKLENIGYAFYCGELCFFLQSNRCPLFPIFQSDCPCSYLALILESSLRRIF